MYICICIYIYIYIYIYICRCICVYAARSQVRPARVDLRPHELDIARAAASGSPAGQNPNHSAGEEPSLLAEVLRVSRSGPLTRITCQPHNSSGELHVDLPTATARDHSFQPGETVAITPRNVRVFLPDPEYVI